MSDQLNLNSINRNANFSKIIQKNCNYVIIGEYAWSSEIHDQIIARLDRGGQTKKVNVMYAHTNWGSDPPILDIIGVKYSQSRGIFDPNSKCEAIVTPQKNLKALALKFLENQRKSANN